MADQEHSTEDNQAPAMKQIEGHTVHRYDGELSKLHVLLIQMGGLVHDQVLKSLQSLEEKDLELAREILERDNEVDDLELQVDSEIESILARRTPVARDLRTVLACSKSVTDLERIGDEAIKIARITLKIYDDSAVNPSENLIRDIFRMGRLAAKSLMDALNVLDTFDAAAAETLIREDDLLDREFQDSMRRMATFMMEDARNVGHSIRVVLAIKALERIGDHAGNIAENVIYLVHGKDIRHQR